MKRIKDIKNKIINCVEAQTEDLCKVDTEELGQAIDMIKDLEEACYYHAITEAMYNPTEEVTIATLNTFISDFETKIKYLLKSEADKTIIYSHINKMIDRFHDLMPSKAVETK